MTNTHTIISILDRAEGLATELGWSEFNRTGMALDFLCVHDEIAPMDLDRLLTARDGEFAHDVFGIWNHFDRETLTLTGGFCPRFAINQ